MKKLFLAAALTVSVALPLTTHAGVPVVDAGSIAQAVLQVKALADQYQTQVQQFEIQKKNLDALKDTVGSLGYIKNSSNIYNSTADIEKLGSYVVEISKPKATKSPETIKAEIQRLAALYNKPIADSNARIKGNLDVINTLKTKLAQSNGANVNTSASAKLNAAIQDAYQQIEMEKSLQLNLQKTVQGTVQSLNQRYVANQWKQNAKRAVP